jgi:hypothetical protein
MKPSKKTLSLARLIHVYVSMALMTLLLFFSITGITLNHPEWFSENEPQVIEQEAHLDHLDAIGPLGEQLSVKQAQLVKQQVEQALAISLADAKQEMMSGELFYSIKQAGKSTTVSVELATGDVYYEDTHYGWWALLNDLHKGRNTSNFWAWVIDLSSVLFIIFALSGFILAMPQKRFRRTLILSLTSTILAIIGMVYFA